MQITRLGAQLLIQVENNLNVTRMGMQILYSETAPNIPVAPPVLPGAQRTTLYLCEQNGARIIAFGIGNSQIGDEYQFQLDTWDLIPSGEVGDNLFRSVNVSVKAAGAFVLGVTPIVDGVEMTEQVFSSPGMGEVVCQAFVQSGRGARCSARVRTIDRSGDLEIENVSVTYVPIRVFP